MALKKTTPLVDGLGFPEGPRWHAGKLWFSDFSTRRVSTVDTDGRLETVVVVPGQPSGLGWLPDESLLVVSMADRRLMRFHENRLEEYADISQLASSHCNDMVVDGQGRAYIGNFGADLFTAPFKTAEVVLVQPDRKASVVANEMAFPNGSVITPDGRTLIVAETRAARLTAFDIQADGNLANRRVWAQFDDLGIVTDREKNRQRVVPDGICMDADGAIWVASPSVHAELLRVHQGGEITHRYQLRHTPFACMLGGEDRRTLFIMTSSLVDSGSVGCIETIEVEVPGAGLP